MANEPRAREVLRMGDALFSKKRTVDSLWQEIAENFYPERAEFTSTRLQGEEPPEPGTPKFDAQVKMIVDQLRDVPMERSELPRFLMVYVQDMSIHRGAITTAQREIEKIRGWDRD